MNTNVAKLISSIAIALSIVMLFFGWIGAANGMVAGIFGEAQNELESAIDEIEDNMDRYEDEMEAEGIKVPVKTVIKSFKRAAAIFDDNAISPAEIAFSFDGIFKVAKEINEVAGLSGYTSDFEELEIYLLCFKIYFWLSVALAVLYIALHVFGKRNLGIPMIIIQTLAMLLTLLVVVALNSEASGTVVKLGAAPVLVVVFLIASAIIWGMGRPEKAVAKSIPPYNVNPGMDSNANAQSSVFCGGCGAKLSAGTRFCPECGKQI